MSAAESERIEAGCDRTLVRDEPKAGIRSLDVVWYDDHEVFFDVTIDEAWIQADRELVEDLRGMR